MELTTHTHTHTHTQTPTQQKQLSDRKSHTPLNINSECLLT
jgi:hypothetical protein